MEIREIREDSEDLSILEAINEEAIPEIERCALSDMLATGAKVWCIDHEQEPVGFMAVRYYRNLVYLAYFAVRKDLRSKGIGGRAVRELIRQNPDKQVVVEYEAPNLPDVCNDIKRFYLRNGFLKQGGLPTTTTLSLKSAAHSRISIQKNLLPSRKK